MPGTRTYHYLIDGLTDEKVTVIRKSLSIVPGIASVQMSVPRSEIVIESLRDVTDQVRIACDVAGVHFRTRTKLRR